MKLRTFLAAAALTLVPVVAATPAAFADKAAVYTSRFSNVAVEGHDPVAYFTDGEPVKGSKTFTTTYEGAVFRFASAENLAIFKADPAAYAPQYGGYCAWAMAEGKFAKGDADYWAIVDGKLYLNYNKKVQRDWNVDRPGFIVSADAVWPMVLRK